MLNHAKLILLAGALSLPMLARAEEQAAKQAPVASDPADEMSYAGVGFAVVDPGVGGVSNTTSLTGVIGVHPKDMDWIAGELELGTSVSAGNVAGSDKHFNLQQGAVFAALRSPGIVYGLGRVGYEYMNTGLDALAGHHSGAAWSLGAGWHYRSESAVGPELLYTHVSNGVSYWGLRINFGFGASKKPAGQYLDH